MARRAQATSVSVVEAAYLAAASEKEWLEGLLGAAEGELDEGLGTCAYVYDASRVPIAIGTFVARNMPFPPEICAAAVGQVDEEYVSRTWRSLSFGMGSQEVPFSKLPAARGLLEVGVRDMVAVNAVDPSGIGVWVGAPLPQERRPRPNEARNWRRIATHIAAAFRLRRRESSRTPENAAAVLSPSGKVEHARDAEAIDAERAALRDAVCRMERARGPLQRRDPDRALDMWTALVEARYSLLDHFESGGRRYVVAIENAPADSGPDVLASRERQVLAAAAAGRTNKLIAYELGLSHSTVRVLFARAARKLGAASRRELVAIYSAYQRGK
jgi:DNA-binding CsgD family transcriptional regulator